MRDPFLVDALMEYHRVFVDLKNAEGIDVIREDICLLCEISRDATIRLLPFSAEMTEVLEWAATTYDETLKVLETKPSNDLIKRYAAHIRSRSNDYKEFLAQNAKTGSRQE
ncbi:MAG: hypothetical protein L0Y71_15530 [Gemmataceae bacterium]|nr:hypothetical protein [Gemmataceae bacterium]